MLRLYLGGFQSQSRERMLGDIKAVTDKMIAEGVSCTDPFDRCFLIVPEQQTLAAEKEMCELLPGQAPLCFEATNFTRFVNNVQRVFGGLNKGYCHSAEASLIMWRTINENSHRLHLIGRGKTTSGTVSRALMAVKDLQSRGVSPEDLCTLKPESITDNHLRDKLTDISILYSGYKENLLKSFRDVNDDLLDAALIFESNPEMLKGTSVFVDGFTSFTEPQYKLLCGLMRHCEVNVRLAIPKAGASLFEYSEVQKTKQRLLALADREGVKKEALSLDAPDTGVPAVLTEICRLVCRREGKIDNDCLQELKEDPSRVRIFEAGTIFDECDFVASDIRRRVSEGARYSDFAIISRSTDKYVGILDVSLSRASIPHFISQRGSIMSHEAIKLIFTAYSIAIRGFMREDVMTYVKCGLSGLGHEERDEFELYCEAWKIEGSRFTDKTEWNMNPDGYALLCETSAERLRRINESRRTVISPLSDFRKAAMKAATVREHALALMSFFERIDLESSLYERAKALDTLGESSAAEENARLWESICDSLDTLVTLCGDSPADAESFSSQLSVVFSEKSIGRIPAVRDSVTVGSADMLRAEGKRHVYLIGVCAGEFPAAVSDSSYFTDREKLNLGKAGIELEPDLEILSARERYCFVRALSFAKESVTLVYASKTSSGDSIKADELIGRIVSMTDGAVNPVRVKDLPLLDRIYSTPDALLALGEAAGEDEKTILDAVKGRDSAILKIADGSIKNQSLTVSDETLKLVYRSTLRLSQTKIEKFRACPFSYYCKYALRLSEPVSTDVDARIIGNFVHAILENFFKALSERGSDASALTPGERDTLARESAHDYVSKIFGESGAKTRMVINRLFRAARPVIDAMCDEFTNCGFKPVFFELKIDKSNPTSPDPICYRAHDGSEVVIDGTVDRVDLLTVGDDVYVRILDYKTGSKEFSSDDVADGENLQMFLYMKSITDSASPDFRRELGVKNQGKIIPAGVLYASTKVKDTTVNSSSDLLAADAVKELYIRQGMILDDKKNLEASNPLYLPRNAKNPTDYTYTLDRWSSMMKDIETVVLDTVDQMKSNEFKASPREAVGKSTPCDYCNYRVICRSAKPSPRTKK